MILHLTYGQLFISRYELRLHRKSDAQTKVMATLFVLSSFNSLSKREMSCCVFKFNDATCFQQTKECEALLTLSRGKTPGLLNQIHTYNLMPSLKTSKTLPPLPKYAYLEYTNTTLSFTCTLWT